jgi:hypothetical protein
MSADKCPLCGANLRQYGWEVVCEEECGFYVPDITDLQKVLELLRKEHPDKLLSQVLK